MTTTASTSTSMSTSPVVLLKDPASQAQLEIFLGYASRRSGVLPASPTADVAPWLNRMEQVLRFLDDAIANSDVTPPHDEVDWVPAPQYVPRGWDAFLTRAVAVEDEDFHPPWLDGA